MQLLDRICFYSSSSPHFLLTSCQFCSLYFLSISSFFLPTFLYPHLCHHHTIMLSYHHSHHSLKVTPFHNHLHVRTAQPNYTTHQNSFFQMNLTRTSCSLWQTRYTSHRYPKGLVLALLLLHRCTLLCSSLFCPALSCYVMSCPVMSCHVLSCPASLYHLYNDSYQTSNATPHSFHFVENKCLRSY